MSIKGSAESYIKLKGSISIPTAIVGKSAYEVAVANGFDGTEVEWLASLKGEKGATGEKGDKGDKGDKGVDGTVAFNDLTDEQKASLKGDKGESGTDGADGKTPVKGVDYFTEAEVKAITADLETKLAELEERIAKIEADTPDTPEEPENPAEYVISAGEWYCELGNEFDIGDEWEARLEKLGDLTNKLPITIPVEGSSTDCNDTDGLFDELTIGEDGSITFSGATNGTTNIDYYEDGDYGTGIGLTIENDASVDADAYAVFTTLFEQAN